MNTFLVPVSSTVKAVNTLQYTIDLVQHTGAKIYLVKMYGVTTVVGKAKNMDDFFKTEAKRELEKVLAQVDTKSVHITSKAIKGDVKEGIKTIAKTLKVDAIVTSSKNKGKLYIGKIPGYFIKHTDLPVLCIPRNYQYKKIDKILMVIKSGLISSPDVLTPLKSVLTWSEAKLNILQIVTPNAQKGDDVLSEALKSLKHNFIISENSSVSQGVSENIKNINPDLLCVIRRKRGFFRRLWEKDEIYKKNFESNLPLLVLKGSE